MGLPTSDGHAIQVLSQGATQSFAFDATGTDRVQVSDGVRIVELWADQDCHVAWGGSGVTATTSDRPMTAKIPILVSVPEDGAWIAAIQQSAAGTLYITDLP